MASPPKSGASFKSGNTQLVLSLAEGTQASSTKGIPKYDPSVRPDVPRSSCDFSFQTNCGAGGNGIATLSRWVFRVADFEYNPEQRSHNFRLGESGQHQRRASFYAYMDHAERCGRVGG